MFQACRATVDFFGAIEAARDAGIVNAETIWLDVGFHPLRSKFIKHTVGPKAITVPSLKQATDPCMTLVPALHTFFLSGLNIERNESHEDFSVGHLVLPLPSYKWDLENYWIM